MKLSFKRLLCACSALLAFALVFNLVPIVAFATDVDTASDITGSVEIYLSVSHDAGFFETPTGEIMAFKKLSVPYFDLANYDLQQFYFVSETYGRGDDVIEDEDGQIEKPSSDLMPGNAEFAKGKVTMLHAIIYATEVYYCGVDPKDAGKGYLKTQKLIGTTTFAPEGSVGSLYLRQLWGMDENLNYYHNYKYPLASEGWGSTADQILLHDGDIITIGHFTSWEFHKDPKSVFNFIKAGESTVTVKAEQGTQLDMTVYLAGKGGNYTTAHIPRTEKLAVYYIPLSELDSGVVTGWNYWDNADTNGSFTMDTSWLDPGEYLVCVAGQYGAEVTNHIVSTPGGILLTVTKSGDVNGDGSVNIFDLVNLRKNLVDGSVKIDTNNADLNGDGNVNIFDLVALRKALVAN